MMHMKKNIVILFPNHYEQHIGPTLSKQETGIPPKLDRVIMILKEQFYWSK